jgi:hypothetical protein
VEAAVVAAYDHDDGDELAGPDPVPVRIVEEEALRASDALRAGEADRSAIVSTWALQAARGLSTMRTIIASLRLSASVAWSFMLETPGE